MKIEIAVESDFDIRPMYLITRLAEAWRSLGHDVEVRSPAQPSGDPDLAVLHVDRSVIAEAFVRQLGYSCPIVNGAVLDITKRRISRRLVARHDGYEGPVIVKTDENCGGLPELARAPRPGRVGSLMARAKRRMLPSASPAIPNGDYQIHEHPRDVPGRVWRSRRYVVEQFTPERDGDFYVLRNWVFLGDHEFAITCWSRDPLVKAAKIERREYEESVPDELREMRRSLGFDYGKFDWVLVDGRVILLDANRTPTVDPRSERATAFSADLAPGIDALEAAG